MGDVQKNFVGTESRNFALMLWPVFYNAIALVRLRENDEQEEIGCRAGFRHCCSLFIYLVSSVLVLFYCGVYI